MKKILLTVIILVTLIIASCGVKTEAVISNDSLSVDSLMIVVDTVKVVK